MTEALPFPWDVEDLTPVVTTAPAAFQFVYEARPVPQARPRASVHHGKAVVHKADQSRCYELELADAARQRAIEIGWVPYGADVDLMFEVHVYRAADQGDLTNFIKAIEDALTQAGVWLDDRRVMTMVASMHVDRERPRVVLAVQRWVP